MTPLIQHMCACSARYSDHYLALAATASHPTINPNKYCGACLALAAKRQGHAVPQSSSCKVAVGSGNARPVHMRSQHYLHRFKSFQLLILDNTRDTNINDYTTLACRFVGEQQHSGQQVKSL